MESKLDTMVMVSEALAFTLPVAFASVLGWGAYTHLKILDLSYTLQSSGVGAVFQYIVFSILWVAFFWLVVASVIAGGMEMATSGARPFLELFGLPIPKSTPEQGFRTMFTAIIAWELVNVILQSVFGLTPPSPVSAFVPKLMSIGGLGTILGMGLGAVILVPIMLRAIIPPDVVIEL
jgi:hypothetical protein